MILGAVGHLHHAHAATFVVEHLALDGLEHLYPKDPVVLKCYDVVIYDGRSDLQIVEFSCEFSPGKQGVSETLP